ncbi:MAG: carbon-nitrogen hydrolase family protein [Clostridia bacterium]|nr:carbon-nitrogen hydrolase family protein [Clostridia bacterium]
MGKVRIECVSLVTTDSKKKNLENYVKYIEDAAANGVNILVLPEYSSTGLPDDISMNYVSAAERRHFLENAELIPQGETVSLMCEKAKEHGLYICWTMIEQDQFYDDRIYNTAVLVGPEGLVGTYRKVHRAGTEKMMFLAGDKGSDVFDTAYGKVGLIICFDKNSPDTVRALKLKGAEIIINPTAWPGLDRRLGNFDVSMQLHRYAGRNRAFENGVVYVDCNLGCRPDDTLNAEAGHSRIITPLGEIFAETKGWGESKIVVDIDPQEAIAEYYRKTNLTPAEHLRMLQEQQDKHEKYMALGDVILTNIRFYGSAVLNTVIDFPTRMKYRKLIK